MIKHTWQNVVSFPGATQDAAAIPLPEQDELIQSALRCLESRIRYQTDPLSTPYLVQHYLRLQLAQELNEVFAILFLDNAHRVLAFEKLFQGSINTTIIHGRVIVQRALAHNAAAVIFAHNHPSGNVTPSSADQHLTERFKSLLLEVDIRVLDHIIVSAESYFSFLEKGWL